MCGRFVSTSPPGQLARHFAAELSTERSLEPSWNVAPTGQAWVVLLDDGQRRLEAARWGLVPPWADDVAVGSRMFNARAETLAARNAYKRPLRRRRCVVPVDGFYEWRPRPGGGRKQPFYFHDPSGNPLALAGLWERWRAPGGTPGVGDAPAELRTFTVVTRPADEVVGAVHDRMPAVLTARQWERWLDPALDDPDVLTGLAVGGADVDLDAYPVSTAVNDARNDGRQLIEAVGGAAAGGADTLL